MSDNYLIKKCIVKKAEGSALKTDLSLLNGNPVINYHESILSPAISLSVTVFDVDNFVSNHVFCGGEYIEVEIISDEKEGKESFKIDSKHNMMINGVKGVSTGKQGQVATLEAVPVEIMVNETARITKKFSENISDTVKDILVTDVKGIQTTKKLDAEEQTINKYSFVGNYKRPIDIIQWLQPKAGVKGEEGESYGFLFYETLDGYQWKSIETLLKQEPENKKKGFQKVEVAIDTSLQIFDDSGSPNTDSVMSLRRGMYANKTIYVNLETCVKTVEDFAIKDVGAKCTLPKGLDEKPTKLMFRILDPGALQKGSKKENGEGGGGSSEGDEPGEEKTAMEKQQDLAKYQNKSYARNNLLFSTSMSIAIPFNPKLRAGQMVFVQFPIPDKGNDGKEKAKMGTDKDDDPSGNYLIAELKHSLGNSKGSTQLSLVRDTFTVK